MKQSTTTPKNGRAARQRGAGGVGLLANGACGGWEIAIDETTSGADRWYAQIEGPSVEFYFEIPSVDIVGKMIRFLEACEAQSESVSLTIGKSKSSPVTLVRDDEYEDRVFLIVGPREAPLVRFTLAGADVVSVKKALHEVQEDLDDEA